MTYTDYLGNPIADGDTILWPDQRGVFNKGVVLKIVALIPHRDHPVSAYYNNMPQYMREDQANKPNPTVFRSKDYEDAGKRYVIQVMKDRWSHWRGPDGQYQSGNRPTKYTLPSREAVVVPVKP